MRTTVRSIPPPAAPAAREADLLATAAGIGERLVRAAVWYRGQCNWVGPDGAAAHRALPPALDHGTAGVALFLAELAAATGDGDAHRTALGAIRQALAHAERAPAAGFYGGRLGIAFAAARCAALLGEERIAQRAGRLARARRPRHPARAFDLCDGAAGTAAGLLALARLLGDERLVRRAQLAGDELIDGARRGPDGCSWPAPQAAREHGRCGMAHGASGAAWALLALFEEGGDPRHREAAERALAYERGWYDAQQGGWPDLRGIERRERRGTFDPPLAAGWSDGAPGIALVRLRAWRILADERSREEAQTALRATAAQAERDLLAPGADFSLARGLGGAADVLLLGAQLHPDGAVLARRAAEIAASRHAASLDGWPCAAAGGGLAPGLLAGHAGIGLLYLRLHDRAVPSPLLAGAGAC